MYRLLFYVRYPFYQHRKRDPLLGYASNLKFIDIEFSSFKGSCHNPLFKYFPCFSLFYMEGPKNGLSDLKTSKNEKRTRIHFGSIKLISHSYA